MSHSTAEQKCLCPRQKDLFDLIYEVDYCFKNGEVKRILVMGKTRMGKTALTLYLQGRQMVAVLNQNGDGSLVYEPRRPRAGDGKISHDDLKSQTVVPNIYRIKNNKGEILGIIDNAGFHDKDRTEAEVFIVSHQLRVGILGSEQFQNILAVDHGSLAAKDPKILSQPFRDIIQLFNSEYLVANPEIKTAVMNSIALVVTKAESEEKFYLNRLKLAISGLKKDIEKQKIHQNSEDKKGEEEAQRNRENKLVMNMMESIVNNQRLALFKEPKEQGEVASDCEILDILFEEKRGWQPFKMNELADSQQLIKLPFQRQFKELPKSQQDSYHDKCLSKKKMVVSSCGVLKQYVQEETKDWNNECDIEPFFEKIREIIQNNNKYGTMKEKAEYLEMEIPKEASKRLSGIPLLDQIKDIDTMIPNLAASVQENKKSANKFHLIEKKVKNIYEKFMDCFCDTPQRKLEFINFIFINIKAIYECAVISQIDQAQGAEIFMNALDAIFQIVENQFAVINTSFLRSFNFKKHGCVDKYQENLMAYKSNYKQNKSDKYMKMNEITLKEIAISEFKMDNSEAKGDFQSSVELGVKNLEACSEYQKSCQDLNDEQEKYLIEYKMKSTYKGIAKACRQICQEEVALKIYDYLNDIDAKGACLNQMIEKEPERSLQQFKMSKRYAEFLLSVAQKEEAKKVYYKILGEFIIYPMQLKQIKAKLRSIVEDQPSHISDHINALDSEEIIGFNPTLIDQIKNCLKTPSQAQLEPDSVDSDRQFKDGFKAYEQEQQAKKAVTVEES